MYIRGRGDKKVEGVGEDKMRVEKREFAVYFKMRLAIVRSRTKCGRIKQTNGCLLSLLNLRDFFVKSHAVMCMHEELQGTLDVWICKKIEILISKARHWKLVDGTWQRGKYRFIPPRFIQMIFESITRVENLIIEPYFSTLVWWKILLLCRNLLFHWNNGNSIGFPWNSKECIFPPRHFPYVNFMKSNFCILERLEQNPLKQLQNILDKLTDLAIRARFC